VLRESGGEYFNPDEAAHRIRSADPGLSDAEANAAAWQQGKRLLERAIEERLDFAFESTLGGRTIPVLLARAASLGIEVRIWYVGLASVELHLKRIRVRVARGGHDIPEADVRRRWETSRRNIVRLLPSLAELRVYDNSAEADPAEGDVPAPVLLLHMRTGRIVGPRSLAETLEWAKPLVAAALRLDPGARSRLLR
jgi:predicted ABC-type ATPase